MYFDLLKRKVLVNFLGTCHFWLWNSWCTLVLLKALNKNTVADNMHFLEGSAFAPCGVDPGQFYMFLNLYITGESTIVFVSELLIFLIHLRCQLRWINRHRKMVAGAECSISVLTSFVRTPDFYLPIWSWQVLNSHTSPRHALKVSTHKGRYSNI